MGYPYPAEHLLNPEEKSAPLCWGDQPRDQIQHQHSWQSDAIPSRSIQYAVHSTLPKMLNLNLTLCLFYRRYSWWRSELNYTWGNSWTRAEWYFTPALFQSISAKGQRSGDSLEVETKELQPKAPPELLLDVSASIVSKRPSGDGEEAVFRCSQTRSLLRCVCGLTVPEGPGHLQ